MKKTIVSDWFYEGWTKVQKNHPEYKDAPPVPKRELLHRNPEAYLCEALAVLDWHLLRSQEIEGHVTLEDIPHAAPGHVPEEGTWQSKSVVQENGL
jgi:hypothetical protein